MSWIIKTLVGINITSAGYEKVEIKPEFVAALEYFRGYIDTPRGRISVEWKCENNKNNLEADIPEKVTAIYNGDNLKSSKNIITYNM